MPDIDPKERAKREKNLARLIREAAAEHRDALVTAMGSPPDVANVPDALWEKIEKSIEQVSAVALALLFLAGSAGMADQFDSQTDGWRPDAEKSGKAAERYAKKRSRELGREMTGTLKDRMETKAAEIRERVKEAKKEIERREKEGPAPREAGTELGGEGPRSRARFDEEGIPRIPTREEIERELEGHAADTQRTQAETAGATETTGSNTRGERDYRTQAERAGYVVTAVWISELDGDECKICKSLDNLPEDQWPEKYRDGPPSPHPNCRCHVAYALMRSEYAERN